MVDLQEKFAEGIVYELELAGLDKDAASWLATMAAKLRGAKAAPPPPSLLQQGVAKMKRLEAVKPDPLRSLPRAVNHPADPEDIWGGVRTEKLRGNAPKPEWKAYGKEHTL